MYSDLAIQVEMTKAEQSREYAHLVRLYKTLKESGGNTQDLIRDVLDPPMFVRRDADALLARITKFNERGWPLTANYSIDNDQESTALEYLKVAGKVRVETRRFLWVLPVDVLVPYQAQ